MPFLTPNEPPVDRVSRRFIIPKDPYWLALVTGAFSMLIYSSEWEMQGDLSPEDTAQFFKQMLLDYARSDNLYIGAIVSYATTDAPNGILLCDGAVHLRSDYPQLYAALDAQYIIDTDSFFVPDLRSRFVVAAGAGAGLSSRALGDEGGEETHLLTSLEMPTHTHGYTGAIPAIINGGLEAPASAATPFTSVTDPAGGGQAHNNMPPFYALKMGIVYQ